MVSYSTFDNGGYNDTSGNGYSGSTVGKSNLNIISGGKVGKGCQGTSTSKYNLYVAGANVPINNMTISFWCKQPSVNWKDYISLVIGRDVHFQRADNSIGIYSAPGSFSGYSANLSSGYHHIALTADASTNIATLYIDGKAVSTSTWSETTTVKYITMCGDYNQGVRNSNATIDELQFYNAPLTATQVKYIYDNPSLYIATEYSRNVTGNRNWSDSVWSANNKENQSFGQSSAVKLIANPSGTLTLDQNITVNSIDVALGTNYKSGNVTISGSKAITFNGEKYIGVDADTTLTIATPIATSFTKKGTGTLEITNANSYSNGTTISAGTLKLTGNGTLGTGTTKIADGAKLEFNVANGQTRKIAVGGKEEGYDYFNNITRSGTDKSQITKSGDGDLKILLQAAGQISADKIVVSSGRLDIKSALIGEDDYVALESNIDVLKDATFSPGNSIGILELATGKTINVETGGKLLLEIGGTDADDNDQILGDANSVVFEPGSIIEMALDSSDGYFPQNGQKIELNVPNSVYQALQDGTATFSSYYFQLYNVGTGEFYIGINPNAVPEPSTWALLILGFAGLMWYRRKK